MNLLRRLFGRRPTAPVVDARVERPADWALTVRDLMDQLAAGERERVGEPELEWAREYERDRLPPDARYPRAGDVYEVKREVPVSFLISYSAPCSGGGEGTLVPGDRVRVDPALAHERPKGVWADPIDYAALELRLVPEGERRSRRYTGFVLFLDTVDLLRDFELVGSADTVG